MNCHHHLQHCPFDVADFVNRYGSVDMNEAEITHGFQHIVDTGLDKQLHPHFEYQARLLMSQGKIGRPIELKGKPFYLFNDPLTGEFVVKERETGEEITRWIGSHMNLKHLLSILRELV